MEPIRERAIVALVEVLQTMPVTWGGEYDSPLTVGRVYRDPTQVNEFPRLIVLERDGAGLEIDTTVGGQVGVRHRLPLAIYGYVKGNDVLTSATWRQRLWDDVKVACFKNAALGGLALELGFDDDLEVDGGDDPVGWFIQGVTLALEETLDIA